MDIPNTMTDADGAEDYPVKASDKSVDSETPLESEVKEDINTGSKAVEEPGKSKLLFKKPEIGFLVGPRRGKIAGKLRSGNAEPMNSRPTSTIDPEVQNEESSSSENITDTSNESESSNKSSGENSSVSKVSKQSPAQKLTELPIPYKEPKWGGYPKTSYSFEILKSGKILEQYDLSTKSYHVFGRLPNCDVTLLHPTISRFHAVIQYRNEDTKEHPSGFYLYDLGSTHGTFLNKNRVKSNMYIRLHVGHILKFGCSTRLFVLQGPAEDEEEESELSVTQIQDQRKNELIKRKLDKLQGVERSDGEDEGISWGMDEDAEEETDLTINPFAATNNEELYLDDPKKTLRGWFEREGHELVYDVEEKGTAQFLCQIELPVECARGGVVVAEALVKGKKKEAVVQCALEACRILDRYGLLRQATHESKKRKAKDWEADDFYDSDEDTFLDRTGAVEQKRQQRMKAQGQQEVLTYKTLVEQYDVVLADLRDTESRLHAATTAPKTTSAAGATRDDEDALDAYMNNLSAVAPDKVLISKLKSSLLRLKSEEVRLRKLVNIARPTNLPELKPPTSDSSPLAVPTVASKMTAIFGKTRKLIKSKQGNAAAKTAKIAVSATTTRDDEVENEEEEDVEDNVTEEKKEGGIVEENEGEKVVIVESEREERKDRVEREEIEVKESLRLDCGESRVDEDMDEDKEEERDGEDDEDESMKESLEKDSQKRKKKNRKRMQQRNAKVNKEKQARWAALDAVDPNYTEWMPPEGQSGDGRTTLNEKLGY